MKKRATAVRRLCVLTALAMLTTSAIAAKGPDYILLHAGTLLAEPGRKPQQEKTVVVKGGFIAQVRSGYVTADGLDLAEGETAQVVDLRDRFVMPGLMDAHSHLMWSGRDRPPKKQEDLNNEDLTLWTLRNARTTLGAGFTTVRDMASEPLVLFAVRDWIDAGKFIGPRIFAAGLGVGALGGHGDMTELGIDPADMSSSSFCSGPETCRRAVRMQHKLGADFIKMHSTGGFADQTGTEQLFFADEMRATVEAAHQLGLKVATHAYAGDAIEDAVEAGVDSVEHGFGATDKALKSMLKKGIWLVPTLTIAQRKGAEITKYRDDNQAFERALKIGTPIAFGTDVGGIPHKFAAKEFLYMVRLGMKPEDTIVSATVNTAKLFGIEDEVGTLVVGKLADIIAVAGNPLEDVAVLENVEFVMKAGLIAKRDGELLDIFLE